ncbi:5-formyltetrahydrofolate cyclo-ligase [Parasphingorhabdus marina DSM 22363]|uniref:5-formyltetrahydrofolate cyclo-ligase n=1 Tax=Parasphingorhabdus marina DSM 22363 TaxID=1123272 RepID=A0A1N6G386_9SPHN|nr:5-formyltetrahydrofolate cyclo-ligase [Parasphingorhabdus marina]SIO01892.1 5-formyltetrahydrofolate cyclo-ligase [Parasphingorhabdus marina DSM 22363]
MLQENKKILREEYRRRRDAFVSQLDAPTRNLAFRRPPSPLAALLQQNNDVALYSAIGSEAPTSRLAEYLADEGKTFAFPVATPNAPLIFRRVPAMDMLVSGYKDIPEPGPECQQVDPDLIIAPLVAFDRSLNRLGQGQGHYDRTFAEYPGATRVGLAWSVQETDSVPVNDNDIRLHMIVTESEIIQEVNPTP